jgi:hypothetical protein
MKSIQLLTFVTVAVYMPVIAQNQSVTKDKSGSGLPYYEIPSYPATYTAGTVAARVIDGLGFRYYWATEGLREEDLRFRPNKEARTSQETLAHIYDLSRVIVNSTDKIPNASASDAPALSFPEMRKKTLENFKSASDRLKANGDKDLDEFKIIFKRDSTTSEFPFWNQLNGPIADALWHVGQVVSFRRSSGNPFNGKVSVFAGKVKE